jgi:hypothetical protein
LGGSTCRSKYIGPTDAIVAFFNTIKTGAY